MSSGQSLRNGSSVEPGLPNTLRMPKARNRSNVACLTETDLAPALLCLLDTISVPLFYRCLYVAVIARSVSSEAIHAAASGAMDCFASLAMTMNSPHRRALHRRLALGVGDPQLHAGVGLVGVDAELAAFEQRLQAAIARLLRRLAAMQLGRQFDDEGGLQRAMEDQARIALDLGDIVAVV